MNTISELYSPIKCRVLFKGVEVHLLRLSFIYLFLLQP